MNGSESAADTGLGDVTAIPSEDDPNYIFGPNGAFSSNTNDIALNTLRNSSM